MGPISVTQWKGFFNDSAALKSAHLEIVAQYHHKNGRLEQTGLQFLLLMEFEVTKIYKELEKENRCWKTNIKREGRSFGAGEVVFPFVAWEDS